MVNILKDSKFKHVINYVITHDNIKERYLIGKHWLVSTTFSTVNAIFTRTPNGLKITATFFDTKDYLSISQFVPNLMKYSGKEITIVLDVTNNDIFEVLYELSVDAKLNDYNKTNILDTLVTDIDNGDHEITLKFKMPEITDSNVFLNNGLLFTFTIVDKLKVIDFTIHSFKAYITDENESKCKGDKMPTEILKIEKKEKCTLWCKIKKWLTV